MRIDLGYVLGHLSELVLFLYFANTVFLPKRSYLQSIVLSAAGYVLLFIVGLFGYPQISIIMFSVVNFVLLAALYRVRISAAVFYSLILNFLSVTGEYIIMYIVGLDYSKLPLLDITPNQSLAVTVGGKMIYLLGILLIKHYTNNKNEKNDLLLVLAAVPLATIISLTYIMTSSMEHQAFTIVCIMFILINAVTFAISEIISRKSRELRILQAEYDRSKAELSEYELLSEKYENLRMIRHDFRKQLNVLKRLIPADNERANEFVSQMEQAQRDVSYAKYSDNRILNILLREKADECRERGINIHIQSTSPVFGFISDIDTVTIFSNLLDNAIEAASRSAEKEIFVDMYTVNGTYSTFKTENSADYEPIVLDGILRTQKLRTDIHGLGIKSINNALKKYDSELSWSYDRENKFFRSVVVVHQK